jgi:simple sugar transport system permease protein
MRWRWRWPSPWSTPVVALAAVLITFVITAGPIFIAGANPIEAYGAFVIVPLTSQFTLLEVLVTATPILFTGAAVAIAFRAGYWNIGAEGQLLLGAVAAAGVGVAVGGLPAAVALPIMIAAGALAGAAWALVPALLRVRFGIDEVVTTLLLNPVALLLVNGLLHGPWRDPVTGFPESPRIAASAEFPALLERSRLHLGFVLALLVVAAAGYVLARTPAGLRLRAAGLSPHGARFAGINVFRTLLVAALVSGAIAGVAGVSEVAGIQNRLTGGLSPGYGYTGIVVATLGTLTMPGVVLAALFLGDLTVGASSAARSLGVPSQLGAVVQGVLLLTTIALLAVRRHRIRRGEGGSDSGSASGDVAPEVQPA